MSGERSVGLGYLAAIVAVVIASIYPAVTRVAVTATLAPADLLMIRLGVSGILFALVPVLGILSSLAITNDPVLTSEWVAIAAISLGVLLGTTEVAGKSG
jgi:hypothetical protein